MRIKLRRVGTSWGILIPKEIVEPFVEAGFIDVEFPEDVPASEKKSTEISKCPVHMRRVSGCEDCYPFKVSTANKDPLGIKNFLAPPTLETSATSVPEVEELTVVSEEEIPEEYILKPGYQNKRNG